MKARDKEVVHRSFTLDGTLVKKARRVIPPAVADNLNRMVTVALTELVARYERAAFDEQVARMAADPAICREARRIAKDFGTADSDGL